MVALFESTSEWLPFEKQNREYLSDMEAVLKLSMKVILSDLTLQLQVLPATSLVSQAGLGGTK